MLMHYPFHPSFPRYDEARRDYLRDLRRGRGRRGMYNQQARTRVCSSAEPGGPELECRAGRPTTHCSGAWD